MRFLRGIFVIALLGFTSVCFGQQVPEGRLMRFPDVYKDKVVFSYAGDLWLATTSGGEARRITTSPGLELFPKFSPDGKWIAFTAQYDGNFNVYVMPSEGGQPRQLTYLPDVASMPARMGPNNEVISWYPGQQAHPVPFAPLHLQHLVRAALHASALTADFPCAFRCPKAA